MEAPKASGLGWVAKGLVVGEAAAVLKTGGLLEAPNRPVVI